MKRLLVIIILGSLISASTSSAELPAGIFTTILTPLDARGKIDEPAARSQVRALVHAGVQGAVLFGTIGEGKEAPDAHVIELTRIVLDESRGKLEVLVGIQRTTIAEARKLAEAVLSMPVTGIVIMPLRKDIAPTWDYVLELFQNLNDLDADLVYYNYPAISDFEITPPQLEVLFQMKNVQGIKNSMPTRRLMRQHIELAKKYNKKVYTGVEFRLTEFLRIGAHGGIGPLALFLPDNIMRIYHNYDEPEADALECDLLRSINLLSELPVPPKLLQGVLCNPYIGPFIKDRAMKAGEKGHQARIKAMLQKRGIPIRTDVYPSVPPYSEKDARQVARAEQYLYGNTESGISFDQKPAAATP